jgi:hypothetical protein
VTAEDDDEQARMEIEKLIAIHLESENGKCGKKQPSKLQQPKYNKFEEFLPPVRYSRRTNAKKDM